MQPSIIAHGTALIADAGGALTLDDFVARWQRHAPGVKRGPIIDIALHLVNAGIVRLHNNILELIPEFY